MIHSRGSSLALHVWSLGLVMMQNATTTSKFLTYGEAGEAKDFGIATVIATAPRIAMTFN